MASLAQSLSSSVGRKYVMAITGLIWAGFLVTHLTANLLLLAPDQGEAFNNYAYKLASFGPLLWVGELFLLLTLAAHIFNATRINAEKRLARLRTYQVSADAGGKSRKTAASLSMIYTGGVLAVFLVVHVWMFKFGPHYDVTYDGVVMRDLKKVVVEAYSNPLWVLLYCFVMGVLGMHLRHAVWSAFQSLGINNEKWLPVIEKAGFAFAIAVAFGFFIIPIGIFLGVGQ